MSLCARACTFVRCEPTRTLCFCASVPTCKRVCRGAQVRDYVRLYSVSPQRLRAVQTHKGFIQRAGGCPPELCTMCFCAHTRACADELMYESLYICTVRAHKSFVLLRRRVRRCAHVRDPVRLYGASPQGLCAMCL